MKTLPIISAFLLILCACKEPEEVTPRLPAIRIDDAFVQEGNGGANLSFSVTLDTISAVAITVEYYTREYTAQQGADYSRVSGTLTFAPGNQSQTITVPIIGDEVKEARELMEVYITNPVQATIARSRAIGEIINDDNSQPLAADGYITPETYPDYALVWHDEFDGTTMDPAVYTFEQGNNNGWGNNERQNYTSNNHTLANGKLIIEARNEGTTSAPQYTSSRIITKGKQEFKYGRIDIRAKVPVTQGVWPALWMLGGNIDAVSWPACGEIDIMELIGREPKTVHGTAHYGNNGSDRQYKGGSYLLTGSETFADAFHVFSILWRQDLIAWYLDDQLYFQLSAKDAAPYSFPFNQSFFFLFNVAVGGNWPGYPDATSVFPQQMEIDYVRVFQPNP
ncbi:MAG: family 16 glycosylhydrolase [Bacteroidia bacterium]|nr:family 16 glycosylhydrolase [Bacteroidia bacterium]